MKLIWIFCLFCWQPNPFTFSSLDSVFHQLFSQLFRSKAIALSVNSICITFNFSYDSQYYYYLITLWCAQHFSIWLFTEKINNLMKYYRLNSWTSYRSGTGGSHWENTAPSDSVHEPTTPGIRESVSYE